MGERASGMRVALLHSLAPPKRLLRLAHHRLLDLIEVGLDGVAAVLSRSLTADRKMPAWHATAYAASHSNCSASDGRGFPAHFACPLRIMWIISIPLRIARALSIDLKPSIGRTRRLMRRWSCSIQLFR